MVALLPGRLPRMTDSIDAKERLQARIRHCLLAHIAAYGYQTIHVPVIEQSDLYLLKAGETIAPQLCELASRKGLSLRPEHTASVVRAYVESLQENPLPLRLSYFGPVFRMRADAFPQQFEEFGVELLGMVEQAGDLELLALACGALALLGLRAFRPCLGQVGILQGYLDSLGLDRRLSSFLLIHRETLKIEGSQGMLALLRERLPEFQVEVSDSPSPKRRRLRELLAPLPEEEAREVLRDFLSLTQLADTLEGLPDDDGIERLLSKLKRVDSGPRLRKALQFIEDLSQLSGEPKLVLPEARRLLRRFGQEPNALDHMGTLFDGLDEAGIASGLGWHLDLGLSRGLHYYSGLIFEVFHGETGAEERIGGGGRYDGLIELFGGRPTPACGFSFALESLAAALHAEGSAEVDFEAPICLIVSLEDWPAAMSWAEEIRKAGVPVSMMSPRPGNDNPQDALHFIAGEPPNFEWSELNAAGVVLSWEETLARLKSRKGGQDG